MVRKRRSSLSLDRSKGYPESDHSDTESSSRRRRPSQSRRSVSVHELPSQESISAHDQIPKRVYKRYLFLSVVLGTLIGFYLVPKVFRDGSHLLPEDLQNLDSALLRIFPFLPSSAMGPELLKNLTSLMEGFTTYFDHKPKDLLDLGDPGKLARKVGWKPQYPVFIIPGMTSTGLELWEGKDSLAKLFRQRIWGTFTQVRLMLMEKTSWMEHIGLDLETGLDPPGIKIRSAQGLEAADFIVPGYWVWAKIIEALGDIGYDSNNLYSAAYDWRLSYINLEVRDAYFTRLKHSFETSLGLHKRKSVVLSHSLGTLVFHYFMKWVESDKGGRGGKDWIHRHVHSFVNIGGPLMGTPKALSSIVSGEMRDTAQLGVLEAYLVESLMNRRERCQVFQSWHCLLQILPRGGHYIWGKDGALEEDEYSGTFITVETEDPVIYPKKYYNVTADNVSDFLLNSNVIPKHLRAWIRSGIYDVPLKEDLNGPKFEDPFYWSNVLSSTLPNAPDMTIYCAYGVGQPTEIGYYYTMDDDYFDPAEDTCVDGFRCLFAPYNHTRSNIIKVNRDIGIPAANVTRGVKFCDGDGTVPAMSAGYMPLRGWKSKRFNPHNVKVVAREYLHDPVGILSPAMTMRGGPKTSDHVDILGNHQLTLDILQIASGNDDGNNHYDHKPSYPTEEELEKDQVLWEKLKNPPRLGNAIYSKIESLLKDLEDIE